MPHTIKLGDILTDRHGQKRVGPAMTFNAPFWIYEDGVATVNYGEDKAAAFAHYDQLVHERRMLIGNTTPRVLPITRSPATSRANHDVDGRVAA